MYFEKSYFESYVKLPFKITFFSKDIECKVMIFFKKSETTFLKQFCPKIFLMFCVLSFRIEHKKDVENRTPVYFCLPHEFYNFLSIF